MPLLKEILTTTSPFAQRRTQTLSEYISSQYPALKKAPVYRTEGVGEDWEGLKEAVNGSTLANKEEILFIIGHNGRDTERRRPYAL